MSDPIWSALQNTLTVPYTDLQVATSNFSEDNILGKGGYGVVYVGEWKHTKIAVKRFMSSGTKGAQHGTPPLSWTQKREIAEGTACGLHFLHSIGSVPIIHGDVKSANILLDRHFEPKLGDFGLSRDGKVEADADEKSPLIASH
ncbi:hypothetical protein TELCIR_23419, partial [Teladorsagia circumcincta]